MQHTHQIQDVLVLGSDFHAQSSLVEKQPKTSSPISPTNGATDGNQPNSTCSPRPFGTVAAQDLPLPRNVYAGEADADSDSCVTILVENKGVYKHVFLVKHT